MKNSPRNKDGAQISPPSPSTMSSSIITIITTPTRPATTTFVRTNSASFKQVVQMLTGPSKNFNPTHQPAPSPRYSLPPLGAVAKPSSSSSSTIFERRNSKKQMKINPVRTGLPGRLSPSILNIPALGLSSPDTPLVHDPFSRSGSVTPSPTSESSDVEEREIREKGFYLHPSPTSTPTDPKPQLLLLFPLTSPRASDSPASSST